MARQRINDIELYYELTGHDGDTVVLIHGSWADHLSWQYVAPALAERHQVLSYDRRGHSRSERPMTQGSRRLEEDDLAALIETLDLGRVHLVGNSYGGSIALGLAARRPDLVCSVTAHEPPLVGVTRADAPSTAEMSHVNGLLEEVGGLLRAGDLEGGARRFIESVALGPGTWQLLPEENRRAFVANAATFLDTLGDPHWGDLPEPDALPVLLTDGDDSPGWLPALVAALAATTYRHADRHTFVGAGHVPHLSHPHDYVAIVESFIAEPHTVGSDPTSTCQRHRPGGTDERTRT